MSSTQYVTPTLGDEQYSQKIPSNFGESYAAGIGAAGKSISDAISAIGGQYLQNKDTDDTLLALNKNKILSDEEYQSVAGKSLAAKQQVLGLYAGQWIANQAESRQVALNKGQAINTMDIEHAKLLDTIAAIQGKYGAGGPRAVGVEPDKTPIQPTQPTQPTQPNQQPIVGPQAPNNMILKPGVKFGQMVNPKDPNQIIKGWTMPDGSFRPM
jgi:hypothetical protein